jgi:hypothetical protein
VSDTFRTSDLYFAAYLRVADVPFIGIVREEGRGFFLFGTNDPTVMRELKRQYFCGTAKVGALSFVQSIRHLKALLHGGG